MINLKPKKTPTSKKKKKEKQITKQPNRTSSWLLQTVLSFSLRFISSTTTESFL